MNPTPASETLLQHGRFVRELARALVRDPDTAEDLAQEAWTRWLRRPSPPRNPRGWLRRVVRNLASNQRRAAERRARHEALGAREEDTDSPDLAVEEGELLRRVVEAVLALEEPHRETVLARYFRGQSAREVAERRGEPLATVRSRERRALELLRRRLDRGPGGRTAWAAGLTRFLPEGGPTASGVPWLPLAASALAVAGSAALWWAHDGAGGALALARLPVPDATASRTAFALSEAVPGDTRTPLRTGPVEPRFSEAPSVAADVLQGETVDPSGHALAGVQVRISGSGKTIEALSDEQGRFALAGLASIRSIEARLAGYRLLYTSDPEGDPMDGWKPLRVTLVPTGTVRVTVLSGDGQPMAEAAVQANLRREERTGPREALPPRDTWETIEATTDAEGRAELSDVWSGARLVLDVDPAPGEDGPAQQADRQLDGRLVAESDSGEPIVVSAGGVVELTSVWDEERRLGGLVVGEDGAPVAKAFVELLDDGYSVREYGHRLVHGLTGADGRFELAFRSFAPRGPLRLAATAWPSTHELGTSRLSAPGAIAEVRLDPAHLARQEGIRLTLVARAPDLLAGVLLDSCGAPLREFDALVTPRRDVGVPLGLGVSLRTSEGGFAFFGLPESRYDVLVTLNRRSESCPAAVFTRFLDQPTGDFGLRLKLPPSAPVRLRIEGGVFRRVRLARLLAEQRDARGGAVAPRELFLRDPARWLASLAETRVCAEGTWVQVDQRGGRDVTLELGEPGWYRVGVESAPPWAPVATERLWFEAGLHVLHLDPPFATGILRGRLLADGTSAFYGLLLADEQGRAVAIAGPSAEAAHDALPIQASGAFVLRDLTPGTYRLRFGTLEELADERWARELTLAIGAGENPPLEVRL